MIATLGSAEKGRKIICADETFELKEEIMPCGNINSLDSRNSYLWDQSIDRLKI